jgi:hypothetical protein
MPEGDVDTYHEDGKWKNKVEGNTRASSTHETKKEAQPVGRDMAADRGVEHVTKRQDGTIGEKNTYPRSSDPTDIPG